MELSYVFGKATFAPFSQIHYTPIRNFGTIIVLNTFNPYHRMELMSFAFITFPNSDSTRCFKSPQNINWEDATTVTGLLCVER
jgi:hypothetical protein